MAKIITVIPYAFYPPEFGGALRCFYILKEMARCHEVTLITVQPVSDFNNNKTELTFPSNIKIVSTHNTRGYKTVFNLFPKRIANAINSRILLRSIKKTGNLYLLNTYPVFKKLLKNIKPDFVNFENLECFSYLYVYVKRFSSTSKIIYDAHNVDSELWRQHADVSKLTELLSYAKGAKTQEINLHKNADLILCCSESDKHKFLILNQNKGNFKTIPNGVDTTIKKFDNNIYKRNISNLLFCGTLDYAPNINGISWFYKNVFKDLKALVPDIKLTIIGKLDKPKIFEYLQSDSDVNFLGFVPDVMPYYLSSSISVVPLFSGSGTRLKILEAMSLGNPVISTKIGAEGIDIKNEVHFLEADDPQKFEEAIIQLFKNQNLYNQMRTAARKLVEQKYDWKVIGIELNSEIKKCIQRKKVNTTQIV